VAKPNPLTLINTVRIGRQGTPKKKEAGQGSGNPQTSVPWTDVGGGGLPLRLKPVTTRTMGTQQGLGRRGNSKKGSTKKKRVKARPYQGAWGRG